MIAGLTVGLTVAVIAIGIVAYFIIKHKNMQSETLQAEESTLGKDRGTNDKIKQEDTMKI